MSPWDARLTLIAGEAKVRTCHVYWTYHAIAADPAAFNIAAAALFTGLEARHIEAIITALRQNDLMPPPKGRTRMTCKTSVERATRLPADFQVPQAWKLWAQVERGWTPDVAATVAQTFVDHWLAKGGKDACKVDWERTFHNWIRNDRRPNGAYVGKDSTPLSAEAEAERLAGNAEFLSRIGRE